MQSTYYAPTPRDRRLTDNVAPSDAALRLARVDPFAGFPLLVKREDPFPSEHYPLGLGVGSPRWFCDKLLELGAVGGRFAPLLAEANRS